MCLLQQTGADTYSRSSVYARRLHNRRNCFPVNHGEVRHIISCTWWRQKLCTTSVWLGLCNFSTRKVSRTVLLWLHVWICASKCKLCIAIKKKKERGGLLDLSHHYLTVVELALGPIQSRDCRASSGQWYSDCVCWPWLVYLAREWELHQLGRGQL